MNPRCRPLPKRWRRRLLANRWESATAAFLLKARLHQSAFYGGGDETVGLNCKFGEIIETLESMLETAPSWIPAVPGLLGAEELSLGSVF